MRLSAQLHPWISLARLDRPIGIWLLLWPCLWSLALAPISLFEALPLGALFVCGAVLMRSAGCVLNDIVDRRIDAHVTRTRTRPLPSGTLSLAQAFLFMSLLLLGAALVLFQLNALTILLGLLCIPLVAIYPFTKRYTYWPQLFLGLTFSWGSFMGWAAATGSLAWPAFLLYGGGVAWTLGYDTIYAHQDKQDDARLGIKSTALLFAQTTPYWLAVFYALTLIALGAAGVALAAHPPYYILLLLLAAPHLLWQIYRFDSDQPSVCMTLFVSNRTFGGLVFLACLSEKIFLPH